jgi:hypothetical protein
MVFDPIFMILAVAAAIAIVVLLVRWLGGPWYNRPINRLQATHRLTVKERFARGEIHKEEFEECGRMLEQFSGSMRSYLSNKMRESECSFRNDGFSGGRLPAGDQKVDYINCRSADWSAPIG